MVDIAKGLARCWSVGAEHVGSLTQRFVSVSLYRFCFVCFGFVFFGLRVVF